MGGPLAVTDWRPLVYFGKDDKLNQDILLDGYRVAGATATLFSAIHSKSNLVQSKHPNLLALDRVRGVISRRFTAAMQDVLGSYKGVKNEVYYVRSTA